MSRRRDDGKRFWRDPEKREGVDLKEKPRQVYFLGRVSRRGCGNPQGRQRDAPGFPPASLHIALEHAGNTSTKSRNLSEGRGGNRLDHFPSGNPPCAVKCDASSILGFRLLKYCSRAGPSVENCGSPTLTFGEVLDFSLSVCLRHPATRPTAF